jgi:hypothetical protein
MVIHEGMAPVRSRRTVRSMLVLALLALAGGGPAPRGAYAEVAAAARASRSAAVAPVTLAHVTPARAPDRAVAIAVPPARAEVAVARLYLAHSSLLL